MTALNLEQIRAEFPALAGDMVFLDNAGGSQVLRRVADRVRDYLLTSSVQLGASYADSQRAGEKVLAARRYYRQVLNEFDRTHGGRIPEAAPAAEPPPWAEAPAPAPTTKAAEVAMPDF